MGKLTYCLRHGFAFESSATTIIDAVLHEYRSLYLNVMVDAQREITGTVLCVASVTFRSAAETSMRIALRGGTLAIVVSSEHQPSAEYIFDFFRQRFAEQFKPAMPFLE